MSPSVKSFRCSLRDMIPHAQYSCVRPFRVRRDGKKPRVSILLARSPCLLFSPGNPAGHPVPERGGIVTGHLARGRETQACDEENGSCLFQPDGLGLACPRTGLLLLCIARRGGAHRLFETVEARHQGAKTDRKIKMMFRAARPGVGVQGEIFSATHQNLGC